MSTLAELATTMLANVQPDQLRERTLGKGLRLRLDLVGAARTGCAWDVPRSELSMHEIEIVWAEFGILRAA